MRIGVIGAGSWGTALANLLAHNQHRVTLWAYEQDLVARMRQSHVNDLYLPGIELCPDLAFTDAIPEATRGAELLLMVPPSQVLRHVIADVWPELGPETLLVTASKGIENKTLMLMSEIIAELGPPDVMQRAAYLSGPSFAKEVARQIPTAVAVAAEDEAVAARVQEVFSSKSFRVYTNDDVVGVELGGALKNVIAIAAGVSDGLGFGHNARAALITRGLAEITRLGIAKGGKATTFAGLAGMGDLVLTCTGDLSRNRTVGLELGRGKTLQEILDGMNMVAEGVKTTLSAWQLAERLGVEAPIIEQMYQILYNNKPARQAVTDLLHRDLKSE
ncbi:MAG: glycerol-3-phosphate dehydrogenase [Desulfuromonas sp.]|nr:MAG: glycerol-3-phosphate dehydrogenase [Desulfuromonas sp.]